MVQEYRKLYLCTVVGKQLALSFRVDMCGRGRGIR